MKNNRVIALLAVAFGLLLGSIHPPAAAANDAPIRVGFSIAQTGPLAGAGKSGLLALEMWRDDVNAAGGLLGRQVELVVYDDQTNPSMSPRLYTKLLENRLSNCL